MRFYFANKALFSVIYFICIAISLKSLLKTSARMAKDKTYDSEPMFAIRRTQRNVVYWKLVRRTKIIIEQLE